MLSQGAAMRFAEAAARWLEVRAPAEWLALALVLTKEGGKPAIMPRAEAVSLLEKARALAASKQRTGLTADIAAGIDVVKAAAPIEVPLVVFIEREGGEVEMGVLRLALPRAR
ncbi:MAG: hypothetical protein JNL21_41520 [Myxococcales bacterium]|nr:hypothetical protein [Myxococcales bacterium]